MSQSPYKRGKYIPNNISKYVGKHVPVYRSSFELRVCTFFDTISSVIEWASEPMAIQYSYMSEDGSPLWSLYIPDYYVKMNTNSGVKKFLVEVKPYKQTVPPVPPKRNTKKSAERFRCERILYAKNQSKWFYAKKFCDRHGMEFKIVTEKDIF